MYRPIARHQAPLRGLGNPFDDADAQLSEYIRQKAQEAADAAIEQVKVRADEIVLAMTPAMKRAAGEAADEVFASAGTQAMLGTAKRDMMLALALTAVGTTVLTVVVMQLLKE